MRRAYIGVIYWSRGDYLGFRGISPRMETPMKETWEYIMETEDNLIQHYGL